jgi:hypothetical protein
MRLKQKDRLAAVSPTWKCADDQTVETALREARYPAKPRPAKPISIIAQVEGSGSDQLFENVDRL